MNLQKKLSLLRPPDPGERFHVHTIPLHLVDRLVAHYDLRVFIETGTYHGWTVEQVCTLFAEVWTIELDPKLAAEATWKFDAFPHVHVVQGDSAKEFPLALAAADNRQALIWLDAHFSGGVTARGKEDTTIRAELEALADSPRRDHVLMIDDLDDFTGENGYPTRGALYARVLHINPDYSIHVLPLRRGVMVALP